MRIFALIARFSARDFGFISACNYFSASTFPGEIASAPSGVDAPRLLLRKFKSQIGKLFGQPLAMNAMASLNLDAIKAHRGNTALFA